MAVSTPFLVSYWLLWVLVAFQALVLLALVRAVYSLQQSRGSLPGAESGASGPPMPAFAAADLNGHAIDSKSFSGRKTALLFVSTKCISCRLTLHDLDAVRSKGQGNVVVVCHAPRDECHRMAEEHDLRVQVIADEGNRLGELFGITAVPTAVLVDEDLRLASYGHPMSADEVDELLAAESTDREAAAVSVPTPAADSNGR